MINKLTVKLSNGATIVCNQSGWNEDTPAIQLWDYLFDWYQHSAMETFVLTHEGCSYLIKRNMVEVIYCELYKEKTTPIIQKQSRWSKFRALLTS